MSTLPSFFFNRIQQHFSLSTETSKILVVGLGITGFSVIRFLSSHGFDCAVADSREQPAMQQELKEQLPEVCLYCGDFLKLDFSTFSHLIVTPGLSLTLPAIEQAIANGVVLVSDIDLFCCATDKPIIAITGANGKSTVTMMMGEMAQTVGKKIAVGGNLGTSALDLLADDNELYVLELSSFQLERVHVLNAASATVLNISPDHLDRHLTMQAYAEQKAKIFEGDGVMVLNADDNAVVAMQRPGRKQVWFSIQKTADFCLDFQGNKEYLVAHNQYLMPCSDLPLEGRHNLANALAALALGDAVGLDLEKMSEALRHFQGLAHRMQKVANINGVTWVNDSKATNIGACLAALEGYNKKVILLAGGDAKGADMNELKSIAKQKTKAVIVMGKDADLIRQALQDDVPVYYALSMIEAVKQAMQIAQAEDTVLLSPACASIDQYKNYQQRGEVFANAVLTLGEHDG